MKPTSALLPLLALTLGAVLHAFAPAVRAQAAGAPAYIDYQGTAYKSTGEPLGSTGTAPNFTAAPANYTMQFKIWDAQTGGNLIYAETQTVTASLGAFSVRLGSGAPIAGLSPAPAQASIANAFGGKDRYLELTVVVPPATTGTPIVPRLAFQSSPFSFVAQRAVQAETVAAGAVFTGNGAALTSLNAGNIAAGTLAELRLPTTVAYLNRNNTFTGANSFSNIVSSPAGFLGNGPNARVAVNHEFPNVTMTVRARPGDDYLFDGLNTVGSERFLIATNGSIIVPGPGSQFSLNSGLASDTTLMVTSRPSDTATLLLRDSAGNNKFAFFNNGQALKPGGGAWGDYSDVRLKKNVQELRGALDQVLKLRSVNYEYNDPDKYGKGRKTGFIAQEVEKIFPDWIAENRDGYKTLTIHGFESLTVQALRELRAEKDAQLKAKDAEIAELRKSLADLTAKDDAREARLARLEGILLPSPDAKGATVPVSPPASELPRASVPKPFRALGSTPSQLPPGPKETAGK